MGSKQEVCERTRRKEPEYQPRACYSVLFRFIHFGNDTLLAGRSCTLNCADEPGASQSRVLSPLTVQQITNRRNHAGHLRLHWIVCKGETNPCLLAIGLSLVQSATRSSKRAHAMAALSDEYSSTPCDGAYKGEACRSPALRGILCCLPSNYLGAGYHRCLSYLVLQKEK